MALPFRWCWWRKMSQKSTWKNMVVVPGTRIFWCIPCVISENTICHTIFIENLVNIIVIPQQRKLGVFSHNKGRGAVRSSQIRTAQVWEPGSQEGVSFSKSIPSKGSQVPRNSFPSKVSPKQGSQEEVPKQRSQEEVARNRFPSKVPKQGSQARFPGRGSQEEVPRKRFPGRGSQQGSQTRFPGTVTRNRFPSKGSQQEVPKQGSQEQVPKQGSQEGKLFTCAHKIFSLPPPTHLRPQLYSLAPPATHWRPPAYSLAHPLPSTMPWSKI